MPIKIPVALPAADVLRTEGVMLVSEDEATRQDIRPLRIALVNLMPNKIRTETQIARLIGATPLQIELTLVKMETHTPRNAPAAHMLSFYENWSDIRDQKFDGIIVTGAPIELLPFEEVGYWSELSAMFDWTTTNVHSLLSICWGAQAALKHFHNVPKHALDHKAFGVFRHKNLDPASPYLRGFSDDFSIPVSRWTETRKPDLPADADMRVLMESDETGICLLAEPPARRVYMFNHIEYDSTSLQEEYRRDVEKGVAINFPQNYFPNDDPARAPENRWRSHAHLFFSNWINDVYQTTPFDLSEIGQ